MRMRQSFKNKAPHCCGALRASMRTIGLTRGLLYHTSFHE
jgi:hypothetical protein